jgi:hypothetical protein
MASVTFDTVVGGDGSTVTDDDSPSTGLGNGGSILRLVPMMAQVVAVANNVVSVAGGTTQDVIDAAASAAAALASKNAAAASVTQVNTLGAATGLQTTGAVVNVNLSAPPVANQIIIATSPTTATWQDAPKTTPDFLLINAGII